MVKIGAHVSAAGSLDLLFERAQAIGAEATQFFITPPQQWLQTKHSEEVFSKFKEQAKKTQIEPNFIHATYLINLATQNPEHLKKSIDWLTYSQKTAEKLGVDGTIFHIGSSGKGDREEGIKQVIRAVEEILKNSGQVDLILETSAGSGNTIGDKFAELGQIIRGVGDSRIKVCLDTQHTFASGYDWRSKEGTETAVEEFDREVGLDKLVVIHANDSKTELDSKKDRHENIGEGFIGIEGFKNIINNPAFKNLPFILEVPGFDNSGPDKKNIELLRSLVS